MTDRLKALLPSTLLAPYELPVAILGRSLNFLQNLEVVCSRAAARGTLSFVFHFLDFLIDWSFVQQTADGLVVSPEGNLDEGGVLDSGFGDLGRLDIC